MTFSPPEKLIPFSPPDFGDEEKKAVQEVLESGWITTGPRTRLFEKQVAEYCNAKYGAATFSCTDAMHLAMEVMGVKEGDEVITTPLTFVSTAHVIRYCGGTPVLADIDPETLCIDPAAIESKVTSKTKGILPVHYGGHACDMDPILDIAKSNGLFVVEDAAHAIGTKYKDRPVGSIGDITCFSFYATKNVVTAEGGMAMTDDEELSDRMRQLSMYGISDGREIWASRYAKPGSIHYDVNELGRKCNMTDINAALGLVQLAKLDAAIATRREYAAMYDEAFADHPAITAPTAKPWTGHCRHLYPIQLNLDALTVDRDTFLDALKEINIGTSVMFVPIHYFSYYAKLLGHRQGDFPVAEKAFERLISLPVSPAIGADSIRTVIDGVLHLLDKYKR